MTVPTATATAIEEHLADIGRRAVASGLVQATGGNLSARLPDSDKFVVTGKGTRLDTLVPADFAVMNLAGEVQAGTNPSSEWRLHQRTYQERPDVNAIVHVHPQHAVLLDALGYPIRFLTLDHAFYVGSAGHVPFFANGSQELADVAALQAREHNAIVLANHGCSALGPDIEMAYRRAVLLEEAAVMTYRALTLGDTTTTFGEGVELIHQ
ncbi:MAG: class II aldolase/adducin family protein [Bifidobacteriaceae bacterium]|jgi:L-fuculose-phosphate aldolase|nr:class II aldolase/adducin family protein [Bifidobacteriaceae bacterium]